MSEMIENRYERWKEIISWQTRNTSLLFGYFDSFTSIDMQQPEDCSRS